MFQKLDFNIKAVIWAKGRPKLSASNPQLISIKTTNKTKLKTLKSQAPVKIIKPPKTAFQVPIKINSNESNNSSWIKKIGQILQNPQSKAKKTLGISNSRIYQMGIWPMAVVSSLVGLISNIQTAHEILNEPSVPNQIYKANNGQYYSVKTPQSFNEADQRSKRYAITASRMQPFLRVKGDPNQSTISFGVPWFF